MQKLQEAYQRNNPDSPCGIYRIVNIENGKFYIGSSINIRKRILTHFANLRGDKHPNTKLQNAFNFYGEDVFVWEVLEECFPEERLDFEQYYLDYYKPYGKVGYNIDPTVNKEGGKLAEETKEKIRAKAIGRIPSREAVEKTRLKNLGQKRPKHSKTMKEKVRRGELTPPRFHEADPELKEKWSNALSKASKQRYANIENRPEGRCVEITKDSGEVLYFYSISECARTLGIAKRNIQFALRRENKRINKYELTVREITFENEKNPVVGETKKK